MLVGLDWAAVETRVGALGADARARVLEFCAEIEAGALAADSERRAAAETEER